MQIKTTDNMQYIFACLTTHSKWANELINRTHEIHHHFVISSQESQMLRKFIHHYGERILSAAILMEEKRWKDMLIALPCTNALLGERLKTYWQDYLESYYLKDPIPHSPLLESIAFIKFTVNKNKLLHPLIKEVLSYELNKNIALNFQFTENSQSYPIQCNPSLILKAFRYPISRVIAELHQGAQLAELLTIKKQLEVIAFYKKPTLQTVNTISLSHELHTILLSCQNKDWQLLLENKNQQILTALHQHQLIISNSQKEVANYV